MLTKFHCQQYHDDVIKWKHFPRYWPFVWGSHRSPVNSPHKGQWRGALMFSLICVWINGWVNNREAGYLRRYRVHCDVIVMTAHLVMFCFGLFHCFFSTTVNALKGWSLEIYAIRSTNWHSSAMVVLPIRKRWNHCTTSMLHKTSYYKILKSLKAARLSNKMIRSLPNFAVASDSSPTKRPVSSEHQQLNRYTWWPGVDLLLHSRDLERWYIIIRPD